MIAADEDALQCDFMETYGVLDYRTLPLHAAARLAVGLRRNSRIRQLEDGLAVPFDTWLMALCADRLAILCWRKTEDGVNGVNPPPQIAPTLMIQQEIPDTGRFASGEEFEAWRAARMKAS